MRKGIVTTCSALLYGALSTSAGAAEPSAKGEVSGGVSLGTKDGAKADGKTEGDAKAKGDGKAKGDAKAKGDEKPKRDRKADRGDQKWIKRWAPERNMGEIGLFGGVLIPSRRLELFEADATLPNQGFKEFKTIAPSVGLRLGYYPIRFFGVEGEAGVMPTRTADELAATMWGMRASFVGQLGLWSVTPFVLVGGGMLNVASDRAAVGSDIDASVHVGGGLKFYLTRYTMLRLDIRDHITAGQGVDDGVIHSPEALLGFSVTLGRKKNPPPKDTDKDGIYDFEDKCVTVPGVREYEGCPIPDKDGDGILDPQDQCVDVPGVAEYKGCPIPDTDKDGFLDPQDSCINDPETKNDYKDGDGCPDEVPKEVTKFSGVIKGIYFDTDKDVVKKQSEKILDEALDTFLKFPDMKVEISGHTDSKGDREHNIDLSKRRAEAVKKWLVDRGVAANRLTTRGAGPDEPVDSNETKAGRAKNRRIEFKLLGS